MGILAKLAKRFVAGETIESIIEPVAKINAQGMNVSLDVLGEDVEDKITAQASAQSYHDLLEVIVTSKLNSNVSLKLTMMGLDIEQSFCFEQVEDIVIKAKEQNNFVRLDMEGSAHTTRTIDMFKRLHAKYPGHVGIVIQAYLHRSEKDIEELAKLKAPVRICKGAYKENKNIAWQKMDDIRQNYKKLTEILWKNNCPVAIATHDESLIEWAKAYIVEHSIAKSLYEFQVLYGLRRQTSAALAQAGHPVRIYVPFGKQWLPYFTRRLKERKENVWFVVKGLFEQ